MRATRAGAHAAVLLATAGPICVRTAAQAFGDQGAHPLGSMFKLYVFDAVARLEHVVRFAV